MTAEEALVQEWRKLRDDARYRACAEACVLFAHHLGQLTDIQRDTWLAAFKGCPGHDDEGGRDWCAYCGKMPDAEAGPPADLKDAK